MNAISQRFQNMIWFLSLEQFATVFVAYMFTGTLALSMLGTGIFPAFLVTFVSGVVLTAIVGAARPVWRFEQQGFNDKPLAWRLFFGPLRSSGSGDGRIALFRGEEPLSRSKRVYRNDP